MEVSAALQVIGKWLLTGVVFFLLFSILLALGEPDNGKDEEN